MSRPRIIIFSLFILFSLSGLAFATPASADYYDQGAMKSENLLSGAEVTDITGFSATVDLPTNTSVSIQFSQDRVNFVSSSGTAFGWDALSDGENDIDLTGLNWSGGSFYYKLKLETTDPAATPVVSEVELTYDGEAVPAPGNPKHREGTLVSTDLLSGTGGELTGVDRFGYAISSLPYGTHVYAQFSTDQTNWQNSFGTLWDWDELSFGDHFSPDTALDLSALNWKGETSFYYKLRFTTVTDERVTPILKKAGLLEFSVDVGGSANTSADPVAYYNFNEGYGDTAHNNGIGTSIDGTLNAGGSGGNTTNTAMWDKGGKYASAMEFDGTNDYVDVGTGPNTVNSVSFWVNPVTTTEYPVDINGTAYIWINAGTLTAQGFTDPTIYVNGKVSSAVSAGQWHHIVVTTGTALNASDFDIGRIEGVGNNEGKIDEVKIFDYALSADQVKREYNGGAAMTAGSKSVDASGVPSFSNASEYCVPGSADPCSPPVGEWKMEQNVSGDAQTLYDTSGNGNNGTSNDGANNAGMNCSVPGKVGFGCEFDGVDDYVNLGDTTILDGATEYTIAFWYYINPGASLSITPLAKWGADGSYIITSYTGNQVYVATNLGGGSYYYTNGYVWETGKWVYFVRTWKGGAPTTNRVFINGFNVGLSSVTDNNPTAVSNSAASLKIGNAMNGKIDDLKIYNYARTPAQIAWEYNKGKPVAQWRMDEGTGTTTTHNETSNALHGTMNNMESADWVSREDGYSLDFDGSNEYIDIGDTNLNINAISFWINADASTDDIIDLDGGTHTVTVSSGTISANGFSTPTIYVNGSQSSTLATGSWQYVLIKTDTSFEASNMDIGRISAGYFDGQIDDVRVYNYALTAEQVKQVMNEGAGMRF